MASFFLLIIISQVLEFVSFQVEVRRMRKRKTRIIVSPEIFALMAKITLLEVDNTRVVRAIVGQRVLVVGNAVAVLRFVTVFNSMAMSAIAKSENGRFVIL